MLVLSRRTNERILLPGVNVAVQVVAARPGVVRLGIEAPPEVAVFREELLDRAGPIAAPKPAAEALPSEVRHQLRNRLNAMHIGLSLLRQQLNGGLLSSAGATLDKVEQEFGHVSEQLHPLLQRPAAPAKGRPVRKALLVEDDRNERELLAGFLRMAGIDVATAGDGCDALDYLQTAGRPDVVLLDMMLPRCDGPSTIRAIRRDPATADLRILALTGHDRERFRLDDAVNGWFLKPLNPQELLRHLTQETPATT